MVQCKEKTIQGRLVRVLQFPGSRSNRMFVKFTRSLSGNSILVSDEEWQAFCLDFLAGATIDGRELASINVFDDVFAGNLSLLFEIIIFVAEANFGTNFLSQGGATGNTQASPIETVKG